MNLCGAIRWGRTVTPGFVNASAVIIHRCTEYRIGRGHQKRNTTAHTKSDYAQSTDIGFGATAQKVYCGIHVLDDSDVLSAGDPLTVVAVHFRRVSMVEVGSYGHVAGLGDTACHFLRKLANTILVLNNDDRWNRTGAFRLT